MRSCDIIEYVFSRNNYDKSRHTDLHELNSCDCVLDNNNLNVKFSDDGEPQGTGTRAIYELMTKEILTNICIVIVRYFGGILLGAGPLSRAYLNSAKEAIDKCQKTEIYNYIDYTFDVNYNNYSSVKYILESYVNNEVIIKNTDFGDNISIKASVVDFELDNLKSKLENYLI